MKKSEDYSDLKIEMAVLLRGLYSFNPKLRAEGSLFNSLYVGLVNERAIRITRSQEINNCHNLILSMFTYSFGAGRPRETISLLDIKKEVPTSVANLYQNFLVRIQREQSILEVYRWMKAYIASTNNWFDRLTRLPSTKRWYEHVESENFEGLGCFWFEPELLMHVFKNMRIKNSQLNQHLTQFLDELIRTYAQDERSSKFVIEFRINILFFKFLEKLNPEYRRNLLLLVQLHDPSIAKDKFYSNCVSYIASRLLSCKVVEKGPTAPFFGVVRKADRLQFPQIQHQQLSMNLIIQNYKSLIMLHKSRIGLLLYVEMSTYLNKLSDSILTAEEEYEIERSVRPQDTLGSFT